ncbi:MULTISPECIES: GLPGLI family protein [unclassified Sphingobacterium]|uniref:GLPGLI family protein n=1 Tax=unclassified Sphingobacterium TaxID=2609468 RepID=UPI00104861D6|nr:MULTISPECIES: GLPGLI family protein [unclassified Sphingobacterium]MCS3557443.1 GLPGLI family protein [Sphingobacterium sp. JUb21]TCQ96330.1 GLPGLI family protein [Sphingobacterium sp. JUb20]
MNQIIKPYLILIFLSFTSICYGQQKTPLSFDLKITYKLSYLGDSTDQKTLRSENTVLFIQHDYSLFETENSHYMDSITFISKTEGDRKYSFFNYKILKKDNSIITYDNILPNRNEPGNEGFHYIEDVKDLLWKLSEDTLTIGGFLCQKATTTFGNRTWIAYFDPSIPTSEGPFKFKGLPGLIIQISDTKKHWNFNLISIEKGNQSFKATLLPVIDNPLTDKVTFFKNKRYANENFMELQQTMRVTDTDPARRERTKKLFNQALKIRSNWIELY